VFGTTGAVGIHPGAQLASRGAGGDESPQPANHAAKKTAVHVAARDLDQLATAARIRRACILVQSRLKDERHLVHSTTKSITSSLVGIAMGDGLIPGVDELIVPYFREYQPLPEASPDKDKITLEDLLTMRSGLKWDDAGP
jgi:CubicO group peptidase (beta-lactamase class C family)